MRIRSPLLIIMVRSAAILAETRHMPARRAQRSVRMGNFILTTKTAARSELLCREGGNPMSSWTFAVRRAMYVTNQIGASHGVGGLMRNVLRKMHCNYQ
ncbi:hypothetical protein KC366_g52 [Hortaea werneckii]|nr:hypothetical protein KC366_g52 [Hortaea werneckii]